MLTVLAIVLIATFAFLAAVHVYWAFGGRFAKVAAIPELRGSPSFVPGRITTLLVACCLFACAALIGAATGFIDAPVPAIVIQWGCFGLALLLLLRAIGDFRLVGFFKTVRGSRFAWLDSALYSPLCVALAVGVFLVAWQFSP
jgi:Protein of unknown function (DUF3995)